MPGDTKFGPETYAFRTQAQNRKAMPQDTTTFPLIAFVLCLCACAEAADSYTLSTYKNGQKIGTRKVLPEELRNSAIALNAAFQDERPSYNRLMQAALSQPAKDRCFNLIASRAAMASIQAGLLDASANSEGFFRDSISSIEAVNQQTNVTCEMR